LHKITRKDLLEGNADLIKRSLDLLLEARIN
jgi:hypothetical protein